MVVCSARRTGRLGVFGDTCCFTVCSFWRELHSDLLVGLAVPHGSLNTLDVLGYERLGNTL